MRVKFWLEQKETIDIWPEFNWAKKIVKKAGNLPGFNTSQKRTISHFS